MDAALLSATQEKLEADENWLARPRVERAERWREIANEMPYLAFPRSWEIAVIPPFAGAVARFIVRKGAGSVSIYADFYEKLGFFGEPHWEIYPDATGDNSRYALANTEELLAEIAKSLAKQNRDSGRLPKG